MPTIHDYINQHIAFKSVTENATAVHIGEVSQGDGSVVAHRNPDNYLQDTLHITVFGAAKTPGAVVCPVSEQQDLMLRVIADLARADRPDQPDAIAAHVDISVRNWQLDRLTDPVDAKHVTARTKVRRKLEVHALAGKDGYRIVLLPYAYKNVPGIIKTSDVLIENGAPFVYALLPQDVYTGLKTAFNTAYGVR